MAGLTGIVESGLIDASGTVDYRLQPVSAPVFTRANARTAAPEPVGGTVKVASMNVLNYFTTLDTGAPVCGPAHNQDCRGANTPAELTRQRDKILAALIAIDADVVGLMEIENTDDAATLDLVAGLNAHFGAGTYAAVTPPAPGDDAIRVGLIYRPAVVQPVGAPHNYQTSTAAYSPLFDRPPLAQAFREAVSGQTFAVVVNHFKSKGSCPASGPDVDTGQGCWNAKRVAQAGALLGLVQTLAAGDPDMLVLGDLNAYGEEDPIVTLTGGGMANLVARVPAAERYSYVFDGEAGYLDQALATGSLARQVAGVTIWHINADEPSVLDYNTEFKTQDLYAPTPYRSSDHDPVVVGLRLGVQPLFLPIIAR